MINMFLPLLNSGTSEPPITPPTTTPNGVSTWLNLHSTERTRIREILGLEPNSTDAMNVLKNGTYASLASFAYPEKKYKAAFFAKYNDGTQSPETSFNYVKIYDFMLAEYSSINTRSGQAINNPLLGLHTNYDTANGLSAPIDNFETAPLESDGTSTIYKKEPRYIDSKTGGNDRGSWYANDAAFMYMIAGGDHNSVNGLRGEWLVTPIHAHLQEYSNKNGVHGKWLDPFNKLRFPRQNGNFRDLNPGFFYAVWLNGLLTSYDYTSQSSIWSTALRTQIHAWFMEWGSVFYDNIIYNMRGKWGTNWVNNDITTAVGGSWNNKSLGTLWNGSVLQKYGFQEIYANRQVVIMSYLMRVGLYFKDDATHGTRAREFIRLSKQYAKETIAYGYASECSNIDLVRTDKFGRFMQTPIHYAGVALGALSHLIDSYERKFRSEATYENMWEFTITFGNGWDKYKANGAAWLDVVNPQFGKDMYRITNIYMNYYKGLYESKRQKTMAGITVPINGWSGTQRNLCRTQYDRWIGRQMAYYGSRGSSTAEELAGAYTVGRKYPIFPDALADRVGSSQVRLGWNFFNACWLETGGLWAMDEYNFYTQ